jgi:hypothetical protein
VNIDIILNRILLTMFITRILYRSAVVPEKVIFPFLISEIFSGTSEIFLQIFISFKVRNITNEAINSDEENIIRNGRSLQHLK